MTFGSEYKALACVGESQQWRLRSHADHCPLAAASSKLTCSSVLNVGARHSAQACTGPGAMNVDPPVRLSGANPCGGQHDMRAQSNAKERQSRRAHRVWASGAVGSLTMSTCTAKKKKRREVQ